MSNMSRAGSVSAFQGFSISQPAIGASLEWLPAMGTPELDELIHAFLPGPSPIQTKRTHVSMDFFEYAHQTGKTFKFYPVTTTSSPATSSMYDSGYSSGFNVSPVVPVVQDDALRCWAQSPAPFSAPASRKQSKSRSSAKLSSSSSSSSSSGSRPDRVDFSSHPGMRIMTKDGQDVTNSSSRGCKTKEQRDHAHLMRIMKACESCKRKKIKCDPSHKRRAAQSRSSTESRSAKKTQTPSSRATQPEPIQPSPSAIDPSDLFFDGSLDLGLEPTPLGMDMLWDQFIQYDPEFAQYEVPQPFNDVFHDPQALHEPSPSQLFTPYDALPPATHDRSGLAPSHVSPPRPEEYGTAPSLPYLSPGGPHGTNYVDFSLYSPASDILDHEPLLVRAQTPTAAAPRQGGSRGGIVDPGLGDIGAIGRHLQDTLAGSGQGTVGPASLDNGSPAGPSRHPSERSQPGPRPASRTQPFTSYGRFQAVTHVNDERTDDQDGQHIPRSNAFHDQLVASWQSPRGRSAGHSIRAGLLDHQSHDRGSRSVASKHRALTPSECSDRISLILLGVLSMLLLFCGLAGASHRNTTRFADGVPSLLPIFTVSVLSFMTRPMDAFYLGRATHAAENDRYGNAAAHHKCAWWDRTCGLLCRLQLLHCPEARHLGATRGALGLTGPSPIYF